MKQFFPVILLLSCTTLTSVQPTKFDPSVCDRVHLTLPDNLKPSDWLRVDDVKILEEANKKCGRAVMEWGVKNYNVAQRNYKAAEENTNLRTTLEHMGIGGLLLTIIEITIYLILM